MMAAVKAIEEVLAEGKGEEITVLPTEQQAGGLFTHIIIATAGSARHAAALTERVLHVYNGKRSSVEASTEREWVLIDCGDIIVHIMQSAARQHYRLEELWGFENAKNAKNAETAETAEGAGGE